MSFVEQERALFDLVFDAKLREKFCLNSKTALVDYKLDADELNDFAEIRADALVMDAQMRTSMILSELCVSFPITFSIVSSLKDGMEILRSLVDPQTMRAAPIERASNYGTRLRDKLATVMFKSPAEQTLSIAILEAELGMAWTSASLRGVVLDSEIKPGGIQKITQDWSGQPVRMAAYVSAAIIPLSYASLKSGLCPATDRQLWRHLVRTPTPASRVSLILGKQEPRLLIARAQVDRMSRCDPTASHVTFELSEGFAPLFQYINGTTSVDALLSQLKQAGATDQILEGVKTGFQQLLEAGMLETV